MSRKSNYLFESEIGPGRSSTIKSSERIGSPYQSSKEVINPRKSSERIGSPYQSSKEVISPRKSSERIGSPYQSSKEVISPRISSRVVVPPIGMETNSDSEDEELQEKIRLLRKKRKIDLRDDLEQKDKEGRQNRLIFLEEYQEGSIFTDVYDIDGTWQDYQDIIKKAEKEYDTSIKEREFEIEQERIRKEERKRAKEIRKINKKEEKIQMEKIQEEKRIIQRKIDFRDDLEQKDKEGRQNRLIFLEEYREGSVFTDVYDIDGTWQDYQDIIKKAEKEYDISIKEREFEIEQRTKKEEKEKKAAEEQRVILEEDSYRGRLERLHQLELSSFGSQAAFRYKLDGYWRYYPESIRKRAEQEEVETRKELKMVDDEKNRLYNIKIDKDMKAYRKELLKRYRAGNIYAFYGNDRHKYYGNPINIDQALLEDEEEKRREELERFKMERENRLKDKQVQQEREQSRLVDEARRRKKEKKEEVKPRISSKWWK